MINRPKGEEKKAGKVLAELNLTDTLIWQGHWTTLPGADGDGNIWISQAFSPQHTCVSVNAPLALCFFLVEADYRSQQKYSCAFSMSDLPLLVETSSSHAHVCVCAGVRVYLILLCMLDRAPIPTSLVPE